MTAKEILRNLVPPAAKAVMKRVMPSLNPPTWAGVYDHLRDVPVCDGTYDDERRIDEMREQAAGMRADIRAGKKLLLWHDALAQTAAMVAADTGDVRVTDFGGGMGTGFLQLISALPPETDVAYDIVEMAGMCAAARKLYEDEPRVRLFTSLQRNTPVPDIVYVNSVLQYIDDYPGTIRELASLNAPWLLLARTAVGVFPTFATAQLNLPGQVLPYWFLNRDEVVGILNQSGYKLVFEGRGGICYDQSNFPATHRVGQMSNLLFARVKSKK